MTLRGAKGNAHPEQIVNDFGRLGLQLWKRCEAADIRTTARVEHVKDLLLARDGVAHSNADKIGSLESRGIRIDLRRYTRWHRAVKCLIETVDGVMAGHLSNAFGVPAPWD